MTHAWGRSENEGPDGTSQLPYLPGFLKKEKHTPTISA